MNSIDEIYGKVNNLEDFTHPSYGHTQFLSNAQITEYAKDISKAILDSGRSKIVVSETGARPLAYICEQILKDKGIEWQYMKFPRDQNFNLFPLINFYLTDEERQKCNASLETVCTNFRLPILPDQKLTLAEILQNLDYESKTSEDRADSDDNLQKLGDTIKEIKETKIAKYLRSPFLYFDEYVDSGKTLQNASRYFKLFAKEVDFKIVSYFMYTNKSNQFDKVEFSLFDQDSFEKCFRAGAYPFENRIDLIGYYYYMNDREYKKITLEEIRDEFNDKAEKNKYCAEINKYCANRKDTPVNFLFKNIRDAIREQNLLSAYKNNFSISSVRGFVDENHLIRQFILSLEKSIYGKKQNYEYLWQLTDMYGPIWSPMPKENHLDFFSGTEKSESLIMNTIGYNSLIEEYKTARSEILSRTAEICLQRQKNWFRGIDELLKNERIKGGLA